VVISELSAHRPGTQNLQLSVYLYGPYTASYTMVCKNCFFPETKAAGTHSLPFVTSTQIMNPRSFTSTHRPVAS